MNRTLLVLPQVVTEIAEAASWYESKRAGLGVELVARVDGALAVIAQAPDSCAIWNSMRPERKYLIRRFPYVVLFRTTETAITVVAFAHARRRPGYWIERSK